MVERLEVYEMLPGREVWSMVFAVACVLAALWTSDADACAPPPCRAGYTAPASGESIPANVPGLIVVRPTVFGGGPAPAEITLRTAGGADVPFTTEDHPTDGRSVVVRPSETLGAGPYVLAFKETCQQFGEPTNDAGFVEVPFSTAGTDPAPLSAGAVSATVAEDPALSVATVSGSCTAPVRAAVATLKVEPSDAIVPWAPLVRWRVLADGADWARSRWGGLAPDGTLQPEVQYGIPGHDPSMVFARCDPQNDGHDPGLSLGVHTVQVIAEVPGQGDLPALQTQVDLRCEPAGVDGGAQDGGPDGGVSAGPDEAGVSPPGCGCGTGMPWAGAAWLTAASLALWSGRRRRRGDH